LIHFRNFHLKLGESTNSLSAKVFWEVQEDASKPLEICLTKLRIDGMYAEGVTDKFHAAYLQQVKEWKLRYARADQRNAPVRDLLATTGEAIKAQGAFAAAVLRHDIPLKCGESYDLLKRATEAKRINAADADDLVITQRENYLLAKLAQDFPITGTTNKGVTVASNLGAEHRLADNVLAWNAAHPKFKISLIEITPKKVLEIRGELRSVTLVKTSSPADAPQIAPEKTKPK